MLICLEFLLLYVFVQYVCDDCTFLSSEEFSRVQEESVDKISETTNQPEKMGMTVIHIQPQTQIDLYIVYKTSLILSYSVLQNQ